jgi:uncharacterized protein (TIGR00266 family)
MILMANNFCAGCGTPLSPGAKFCPTCGRATAVPQQPVAAVPSPAIDPVNGVLPDNQSAQNTIPVGIQQPAETTPVQMPAYTPAYAPPPPPPPQAPPVQQPVYQLKPLNYKIFGENLPAVAIKLDQGDSIFTQSGGLSWMDSGIVMTTNMQGGLLKGLGRMVTGESLFMATYTSNLSNQEIVIASTYPGSIAALDISGVNIIAQKTAFLCAQPSITLSAYVNKSISSGLFGGEGFLLQRISGAGKVFLEIDGSCVERTLAPGEKIKVDTGNVAAFEESVTYQAEMVKGFKNILFGGEGLFLTTLTGPGKIWLQTMPMPGFAKKLIPYLPKPSGN